jgi:transketolase
MKSTRDAYGEALVELGRINKDVVVLDADVSKATRTDKFAREFPERFFNAGCAEANMMATAAGLSLTGKIPFASTFAVFATCRALDQVRNSICYPKLNVKIVGTHGGITVGADGPTHQSIEDIAIMRAIPNVTVIVPADAVETKKAIRAASNCEGPIYIRLGRAPAPIITAEDSEYEIGRATLLRNGNDATVIACGLMTGKALEAAQVLSRKGIGIKVINMHTIKPLDHEMILKAAKETRAIVTAEEHSVNGGLGGAVAECLVKNLPVPAELVGLADTFAESGSPDELLEKYGLMVKDIIRKVECVLSRKGKGETNG